MGRATQASHWAPPCYHKRGASLPCADPVLTGRRPHCPCRYWRGPGGHGGITDAVHAWKFQTREPGDPAGVRSAWRPCRLRTDRSENVSDGTADMNTRRKSDESIVPATSANNDAAEASAESIEERDSAERNAGQAASRRTPGRIKRESRGLHGVCEAARRPTFGRCPPHAQVHRPVTSCE